MYNFGNLSKTTTQISYLKPFDIYENVVIKSSEVKEGTTKEGKAWKSLNITFGNDSGIYTHSLFYFDEKDSKNWTRGTYSTNNGGQREMPSTAEELLNTISAIGFAFFPEDFKKLQKVAGKLESTEQLMTYVKQYVDKNINKNATCMKLVGRTFNNKVYTTFPRFTAIAQANSEEKAASNGVNVGEWYTWMVSPFNNDPSQLTFTAYEQEQADKYRNAKPTPMKSSENDSIVNDIDNLSKEDSTVDDLLAGL